MKKDHDTLAEFAMKGIPIELRSKVWLVCSGAHSKLKDMQNKNYYNNLLNAFPDYPNPNFHQIELDLNRTFPDEIDQETKVNIYS